MKMLHTVTTEGTFVDLLHRAVNGDRILLCAEPFRSWDIHAEGVVIDRDGKFLINGETLICEWGGREVDWNSHPQGVVIRDGKKFLLNGVTVLYEGLFEFSACSPLGLFIEQPAGKFLREDGTTFYEGELANDDEWLPHVQGVVIAHEDMLLLNGEQVLYWGEYEEWESHPNGVVIELDGKLLFNGTTVIYKGDCSGGWRSHPSGGVVIYDGDNLTLVVYKG